MSLSDNLFEQYRLARNKFKNIDEQQETLYHKRQRIILENSRTNGYKQVLVESKRREWSTYRGSENYRSSLHPIHLSSTIRNLFQTKKKEQSKPSTIPYSNKVNTLPPRIYPSTLNLRSVTSKQSMNINILQQTEFLGQYDRKFLVSKHVIRSSHTQRIQVILFDQHAISERILLERLQTYFKNGHSSKNPFHLSEPIIIARNPRFLYTLNQINLLERTGFVFSSISNRNLLVRAVPSWLLSIGQRQSPTSLLDDIIRDAIDNILSKTDNSSNNIELIMYETLKSLACHNAIKFNDLLTTDECRHLLNELKLCSMPFICAHGRTSAAILWEYETIPEQYQVDMIELKQLASIHKWLKVS